MMPSAYPGWCLHCSSGCVCWETHKGPLAEWDGSVSQSVLFSVRQTYGICGLTLAVGCAYHRVTISICCPAFQTSFIITLLRTRASHGAGVTGLRPRGHVLISAVVTL